MIDLLVAGGGPAGLATAIFGARAGMEVVVVERRHGPVDKACGEGLMPHALALLDSLGVDPPGRPFQGIAYVDGTHRVTGRFRGGAGRGVRRTALHAGLLEAAVDAGVRIEHGDIGPVSQSATSVYCSGFQARYLAAADGLHSPLRTALGLARPSRGPRRWGIRRHHVMAPWSDCVEVYWADGAEAYVTPVGNDCVGVAILTSRKGGFDAHLAAFPALHEQVHGAAHGPDRAAGPLHQKVRGRTAGRVLLVGDSAGYIDALTGEGLGIAFGAAKLAVECVAADRPQDYDRCWLRMSRRYRMLTGAVLRGTASPLRPLIVPAAARFPSAFRGVVNLLAE